MTAELAIYKEGIFHTPIRLAKEYRKDDSHYPWIKVDHAVLVVGFGVAVDPHTGEGLPYWKLQNSWGDHWGEKGYFRMVRGRNELAVEQSPVEGEPELEEIEKPT